MNLLQMPDVAVVFTYCSIGREPTGIGDVDKALFTPSVAGKIFRLNFLRGLEIRIKVLENHEFIIAVKNLIEDHSELFVILREGSVNKAKTSARMPFSLQLGLLVFD